MLTTLRTPAEGFKFLLENVSFKIIEGLSDVVIAEAFGTSIEFVRRQRRFLAPRPPVLPQQLKRGIFCTMEEFMNQRQSASEVKAKLEAWVEANPMGYMEKGLNQIAEEAGVSPPSVTRRLPAIIAERDGVSVEEVKAQRKSAGFSRGSSAKKKETQPTESKAELVPLQDARPSEDERKVISGHFDKALYRQLAHLAIDRDVSMQALMVEALHLLFEKERVSNQ